MAMLEPKPSTSKTSRSGSVKPRPSSVRPQSLPSPETLQKIDTLEKRLAELESKGQADASEIARLNSEIAKLAPQETSKPHEPEHTRKSFFGF